jgi:hypothetical protein
VRVGHWSPRIDHIITIAVVLVLIWRSRRTPTVPRTHGTESLPSQDSDKGYLSHNQDLLLGAIIAGSLSFCAGFFLPIYLSPGANQGPLTGFLVAPFAGITGAFISDRIANARQSHLRWFAAACLIGFASTALLFVWEASRPDNNSGYTYFGCAIFIFGLTGLAVHLRRFSQK